MKQINVLTSADAFKVLTTIQAELEKRGKGAAVSVVDEHGELMAFIRTEGCPLPSILISRSKAYTASRERKPSKELGEASKRDGFPMTNFGEFGYVTWGGGVPLVYDGVVVGAVGVSGLSEDEDIELAEMGAATLA